MNGMVWVRVLVGVVWLNGGMEKLLNPSFPLDFARSLSVGAFISQSPPFFQRFMLQNVVPNAELVAQVVRAAEVMIGLSLILGLLTNLAAILSVVLSITILLSQGGVKLGSGLGPPGFLNVNLFVALLSVVILASVAAKAASFDMRLARRNPRMSSLLLNSKSGSSRTSTRRKRRSYG